MLTYLVLLFIATTCYGLLVDPTTQPLHSGCSFPCSWVNNSYYNEGETTEVDVVTSGLAQIRIPNSPNKTDILCYERSGPFILRVSEGNKYRCFKINDIGNGAGFVLIQTKVFTLSTPPTLCDICSSGFTVAPEIWVLKEKTALGCDVPHTCPAKTGTKCDGVVLHSPGSGCA